MYRNIKAFTFVELIVVITILAVLATIGFASYQWYISGSYDSNRIVQLNDVHDGLELLTLSSKLPFPANAVNITMSGSSYTLQGDVDEKMIQAIDYNGWGFDPEFNIPLSIMLADNWKNFQLLTYVSDIQLLSNTPVWKANAAVVEYWNLFPKTIWKPLWISVDKLTQTPVHRSDLPVNDTYDVVNGPWDVIMYISDKQKLDSSKDLVSILNTTSSCKRIQDLWNSKGSGKYVLELTNALKKEVYCDMDFAGGGWTLVWRSHVNAAPLNFGWMIEYGSLNNDNDKYSLWPTVQSLGFWEIMVSSYINSKRPDKAVVISVLDDYILNPSNFASSSITSNCREFSQDGWDWNSSCDLEDDWLNYAHANWGFISYRDTEPKIWFRDEGFYLRYYWNPTNSSDVTSLYWLQVNGFKGWVTSWESIWDLAGKPGMIYVR